MNRTFHKIVIIDNSPAITGAFKSIWHFARKLQGQYDFTFIIPKNASHIGKLYKPGFQVEQLDFLEISKSPKVILYLPVLLYNSFKILRIVKKQNIQLIHVNDLYNMSGVMVKLFRPQTKLVYHIRLLPDSYAAKMYPIWKRLIEKYADEIIAVSNSVAVGFMRKSPVVIYDSFAPEPIAKTEKSNRLFTMLYLANYIPGKGHMQVLEALKKVIEEITNIRLIFYGGILGNPKNQDFKSSLIQHSQKLGLNGYVNFRDFLENPEQEIARAHLVLNFSESESFSMTTLEALAYGTPVIATDCGGPAEIIENDVSGILVPINDTDAMAAAIVKLYRDGKLRNTMARNGIIRFREKFDLENQAELLHGVYQGLLNASGQDLHKE